MHSDSQSEFIPSSEWANLKKFVGSAENDTLVLVWGNYQDTETAANEVIIRAKEATIGIPNETRQALEDGTTGFERILPGPQRMYPDTDLPPIVLMQERVEKIRNNLPVPFWEKKNHYISIGIDEISAEKLAISKYSDLFEKIIKELKIDAKLASEIFIIFPKKLRKKDINFDAINPDDLFEILKHFANGKMTKFNLLELIQKTIENGKFSEDLLPPSIDELKIHSTILESLNDLDSIEIRNGQEKDKLLTAIVMEKLQYHADGNLVHKLVKEILQKQEN
jgi:glutamyl-tRNA(Gln) amidotransferase subunit E